MIRQFFLNKVTIICTMICMIGCSTDSVTDDSSLEELNEEKRRPTVIVDKTMEVLIIYVRGTDEDTKRELREKYRKSRLLLDVQLCDLDGVETWTLDPIEYDKKRPKPDLDTDNEPVDKALLSVNCYTYKRE
ncbi:hypothetical protein [uncultured Aquimarina sp.]|uniref:hypothetical protein n=1 Tax=uncultured Aquimarina sp. TaxID=575652 RepID=UPI002628C11B|nr:hypothetical protein [uncultured Aquimarina sp.]